MVVLVLRFWTRTKAARNGAPSGPLIVPETVPAKAAYPVVPSSSAARPVVTSVFMLFLRGRLLFGARSRSAGKNGGSFAWLQGQVCGPRPRAKSAGRVRASPDYSVLGHRGPAAKSPDTDAT